MRIFRQLSTRRLLALLGAAGALSIAGVVAGSALSSSGTPPAAEPLPQAIHDAITGTAPEGVTAGVQFTNNLLPSASFLGNASSALVSGGSGRLWITNDGRGRIELQSDAGDTQILWDSSKLTVYDSSSNTAYELTLPSKPSDNTSTSPTPPSLDQIGSALSTLGNYADVSGATPGVIAGQPDYSVSVSPKENGGLFGAASLAWDAANGVPLQLALTAKGDSTPVLELTVTDISFGSVDPSDVSITPPAGTKIVDLSGSAGSSDQAPVTGLDSVEAAVDFPLVAPGSVNGQSLTSARTSGKGALLVYGDGLGALVVNESAADCSSLPAQIGALPTVSIGSTTAHELATPLGTLVTFDSHGVSFVVGGSMTPTDAEAAAKLFA